MPSADSGEGSSTEQYSQCWRQLSSGLEKFAPPWNSPLVICSSDNVLRDSGLNYAAILIVDPDDEIHEVVKSLFMLTGVKDCTFGDVFGHEMASPPIAEIVIEQVPIADWKWLVYEIHRAPGCPVYSSELAIIQSGELLEGCRVKHCLRMRSSRHELRFDHTVCHSAFPYTAYATQESRRGVVPADILFLKGLERILHARS